MDLNRTVVISISKDGTTLQNTSGDFGISVGSMNFEEILCDTSFSLKSLCASKFEVQCFNLDEDVTGWDIEVICVEEIPGTPPSTLVHPIFQGVIDSSTTDYFNDYRDIIAYDKMYTLRDKNVGTWWDTFWSNRPSYTAVTEPVGSPQNNNYYELVDETYVLSEDTEVDSEKTYYYGIPIATLYELRTALCTEVGLSYDVVSLVNDTVQTKQYMKSMGNTPTQVTFGELMSMICEINGVIGHINRQGMFSFVSLGTTTKTIGAYEKKNADFEDYATAQITGINVYESEKNLMLSYAGIQNVDNTNAYSVIGNIFTLTLDSYDVLSTICSRLFQKISSIEYVPCKIPVIVSDLTLQLGDKISSDGGTHYIFSQTFSGSLFVDQTINCSSTGEVLSQGGSYLNNNIVINQQYSSLYQDQSEIRSEVNSVNSSISEVVSAMSSFSQTTDDIVARVERDELRIEDNEDRLEHFETAVSITTDGVTISQGTEGYYTMFTDDGMDIYTSGVKTAWAKSDGFYVTELSIGNGDENDSSSQRWYVKEANGGSTLMFLRI